MRAVELTKTYPLVWRLITTCLRYAGGGGYYALARGRNWLNLDCFRASTAGCFRARGFHLAPNHVYRGELLSYKAFSSYTFMLSDLKRGWRGDSLHDAQKCVYNARRKQGFPVCGDFYRGGIGEDICLSIQGTHFRASTSLLSKYAIVVASLV